jgi:hypothetical protein
MSGHQSSTSQLSPLLQDALERTIANPTAAENWHRLLALLAASAGSKDKENVSECLLREIPVSGLTGFFLFDFLADVTGETHFLTRAAQILQTIRPVDINRFSAFAAYQWWRILTTEANRKDFKRALQLVHLPENVRFQAGHIASDFARELSKRPISEVRKVAVVTSCLADLRHTPTLIVTQQIQLLHSLGLQVALFSNQEMSFPGMENYLANRGQVITEAPDVVQLAANLPSDVAVFIADEQYSVLSRGRQVLTKINDFDPDLVFFIGLFSPLVTTLYTQRPVLGLCVHSIPPIAAVDVWLTADRALAEVASEDWYPALPPAKLGLAQEAVVLVSTGYRLTNEIAGEWAAHMRELLEEHPTLSWLLIGVAQCPVALQSVPAGRIKLLPHTDNIAGVLPCCDIYVNPPRMGGGFSVIEAMAAALPVLSLDDTDGGAKLPGQAVDTLPQYFIKLQALIIDAKMREQAGQEMRQIFETSLDLSKAASALQDACEMSLKQFQKRMENSENMMKNPLRKLVQSLRGKASA